MKYGCFINLWTEIILNMLGGIAIAASFIGLMHMGKSERFLFFNEVNSDKETCSRPSNQTFKCKVYKNGELVMGL
jgi:hypothetical protein